MRQGGENKQRRSPGKSPGKSPGVIAGLVGLAALLACTPPPQTTPVAPPPPQELAPPPRSAASEQLVHYYAVLQQDLLTRGLLRIDGGGPDTPYNADKLVRNFEAIAFFDEYAGSGSSGAGGLSRWPGPVRIKAEFGPSVPPMQRQQDTQFLASYADRLARITGHPITATTGRGNFHVIYAGKDDSDFIRARLQQILPNISAENLEIFANPPRSFYCLVLAGGPQQDPLSYTRGVALIRAEHPDLVRQSCVHEEVAQGLGLRNDSPRARPSIFNDDDEFALLTSHDEKLLTLLYDARLHPGMSAAQARPITRVIANELMGLPAEDLPRAY
ncbi:DUF2927 domain-containing protein [Parasedimentitalea psychrophila]|uniref:DUF2927 domain-containing protein n=1 Tax=Parasedimentitalea psychrophila TaxID=2997337 RepID=A0A9Y2KVJ7_9RHOB|nr:DUF2927 domain-containing protein [Parasedimentitalea psychrophila]WIY23951.1 DUF2927 domain-containing protein [Parasedimentitalea psychrophila]